MRIKTEEELEFLQDRSESDAAKLNNRTDYLKQRGEQIARHYLRGFSHEDAEKILKYAADARKGN